jgi:F-type H+-transporting ATPase subunit b
MQIIPELVPTLLLTVPFLVAYAALHTILFRPLLDYLEGRDNAIHGTKAQAESLHAQAESRLVELDEQLTKARAEVSALRSEARVKALAAEAKIIGKARDEAEVKIGKAVEQITIEHAAAAQTLQTVANELSGDIVNQVLGRQASA